MYFFSFKWQFREDRELKNAAIAIEQLQYAICDDDD